jgi:hypothetical protein
MAIAHLQKAAQRSVSLALVQATRSMRPLRLPRELIKPHGEKRYIRRKAGRFTSKQVNVGRSLAADRRSKSKTVVKKGGGNRGDQKRSSR